MGLPETVKTPFLGFVRAELVVDSVVVLIVLCAVSLRVTARIMGPGLWWDDYFILIATPLGVAMLVCGGLFGPLGSGYPLAEYPELAVNIPHILRLSFIMEIIYTVVLGLVKASMLSFFLRVFVTPYMKVASKVMMGFAATWTVSYVLACIFICSPVEGQWLGGKCGNYIAMIQSLIATNAVGDLIIMALPMHVIWNLNTRRSDKIGITSCFALALACVVCAVFRLVYISTVDLNSDVTGTMPTTVFLFVLEPNLAILCVSIPMLKPFFALYRKRVGGSRLQESDEINSGYRSRSRAGTSSNVRVASQEPKAEDGWEMGKFYPANKAGKNDVTATYVDESGSETAINAPSGAADIRVETKWAISSVRT